MVTRRRSSTRRGSTRTGSARRGTRTTTPRSTGTRRGSTGSRGRTGYRSTPRRRRGTAASFGSAFGLLLVYAVLRGSWPVRVGMLLLAVLLVAGYVWLSRRDPTDQTDPTGDPVAGTTPPVRPQETP